jgi:hypothetical protein
LGLLLLVGLVGYGGGCGPGSATPFSKEESQKIRQNHKSFHQALTEQTKQHRADMLKQGGGRRGARRGVTGPDPKPAP